MEIKSDEVLVARYAAALDEASKSLAGIATATLDEDSTLAGNSKAYEAVELSQKKAQEIAQAAQSMAAKIKSISQRFAEIDQASAGQIEQGG